VDDLTSLFAQPTPWGLTVGQTAGIVAVAVVLLAGWLFVQFTLRLGAFLFRMGCAMLLIFICGLASFIVIYNYSIGK
jgi:hypothetical protein